MIFALLCLTCRSFETNIHYDPTYGYTMMCLNCGREEKVIPQAANKPRTKADLKKMGKIDVLIRKTLAKHERVKLKN